MTKLAWPTRVLFWTAIFASCMCLVFAAAVCVGGIRFLYVEGFRLAESSPVEILIVSTLALQPLIILSLIVRAIRLRDEGSPVRVVARALYPLAPVALSFAYPWAVQYLLDASEMRRDMRRMTGSITYVCSTISHAADYDPKLIGPIELRLTESRHPGKLGDWIVAWPGKKPIPAVSFRARTGSIGGSQGIKWREPDGRSMIAYLSFSDVVNEHGPETIWLALVQSDEPERVLDPFRMPGTKFTCGPDPASYHE